MTGRAILKTIGLLLLLFPNGYSLIQAQINHPAQQVGTSFITNYSSGKNGFERQTWSISTCPDGLTYFANGGLLVGGNRFWKTYTDESVESPRSVFAISPDSILIGSTNELGLYVRNAEPGKLTYESLMHKLDSSVHEFGNVWQIMEHQGSIYLRCGSALLSYREDTLRTLISGDLYDFFTIIRDTIFLNVVNKGFGYLSNGKLNLLPYASDFIQTEVKGFFPAKDGFIMFTDDQGIYRTAKDEIILSENRTHLALREDQISKVVRLNNGNFAVGTVKNGLFILDENLQLLQHINRSSGLQNNTVISLHEDNQGNLWVGLDNGISYIELNTCLTKLNSETDFGTGYVSAVYDGKLYLGTNQGLFYTHWKGNDKKNNNPLQILPVKGTSGQVWNLFSTEDELFCGHHKGLFRVGEDEAILVDQNRGSWQIDSLRGNPGYFLESTYRGFFLLKKDEQDQLINLGKLQGISVTTRIFIQDLEGYFWIVSSQNKIYRFRIDLARRSVTDFTSLSDLPGMNSEEIIRLVGTPEQVFFATTDGLFQFDPVQQRFVPNEYYNQIIGTDQPCYEFFEDDFNRIWYVTEKEIGYFSLHFGKPEKVSLPFTHIFESYTRTFGRIGVLDEDNILFGVDDGFYHFPNRCRENRQMNFTTFIIDLESNSQPIDSRKAKSDVPVYRHQRNGFSFTFTSNTYSDPDKVMYRFKLDGLDEEWSEWTSRNIKEYNNLYEGKYLFNVVSRNKFNEESTPSSYSFIVKPPPYRSPLAIFLYSLLIVGAIILLRMIRNRKLYREMKRIEIRKQEELEKKQKDHEAEQLKANQHITALQKEKLEQELLFKSKELSNSAYNLLQKNEMLQKLQNELKEIYHEKDLKKRDRIIQQLIRLIGREINTKKDWEVFDLHFNGVHEDFIEELRRRYPDLNQNDLRVCIFLKMNKSTKEIATLMNMSVRGVETSRYRIRKKMGLSRSDNLFEVITRI
jgi:ligand-binding sensor domain-containing protein/DNA-binding CsgD family transcriptional regulator